MSFCTAWMSVVKLPRNGFELPLFCGVENRPEEMRTASLKTAPACKRSVDRLSADARTSRFDVPFARAVGVKVFAIDHVSPRSLAVPDRRWPQNCENA